MNHDNSDNDRLPDEQYHDDETTNQNPTAFGRTGTGKTQQLGTELARRLADYTESAEFVDSKGEGEENGG